MKKLTKLLVCAAIAGLALPVSAVDETSLDLEPCINGGVSASGLFPSQEMEEQLAEYTQSAKKNSLVLENAMEKPDSRLWSE